MFCRVFYAERVSLFFESEIEDSDCRDTSATDKSKRQRTSGCKTVAMPKSYQPIGILKLFPGMVSSEHLLESFISGKEHFGQ